MPPKKPPLTHFVCLPLTSNSAAQWEESLQRFKAYTQSLQTHNLLPPSNSATVTPIPVKAIRPLGTLHLTLGVMSLTEPERVEGATTLLKSLDVASMLTAAGTEALRSETEQYNPSLSDPKIAPDQMNQTPGPLALSFTGLKSMHSPKSTSFLYTPPTDRTDRLYPFCHAIKDRFVQGGFMIEEKRDLKLHATVLNTIYAGKVYPRRPKDNHLGSTGAEESQRMEAVDKNEESDRSDREHQDGGQPDDGLEEQKVPAEDHEHTESKANPPHGKGKKGKIRKEVVKFNAKELLAQHADFEWARNVRIEKLAICEMGAKKIMDEAGEVVGEEYTEIASVPLP
ncbi:MAG: hypothetical protein Q9216_006379 [Gyalolechia sp. 2 TL-2023]